VTHTESDENQTERDAWEPLNVMTWTHFRTGRRATHER
jgi:hypothetical protein